MSVQYTGTSLYNIWRFLPACSSCDTWPFFLLEERHVFLTICLMRQWHKYLMRFELRKFLSHVAASLLEEKLASSSGFENV